MGNPHYWLDPENVKIVARNIANRLSELSPDNAQYFQNNFASLDKKIDEKMADWNRKMEPFKGRKIAIYHRSWPYFADRFGLVIACELEPKPGIPPSAKHLASLVSEAEARKARVILQEPFYTLKAAEFVASRTGAKVVAVPTMTGGSPEAGSYLEMLDNVIRKVSADL